MENNIIESTAVPAASQMSLGSVLRIPAVRQFTLLIGVAMAVAAGFAVALWSQAPGYTQLFADMSASEASEVASALRTAGIEYKLDNGNGGILVPEARVHEARMELASQGLPQSSSAGMESMKEQSSFGVSQFMESARYQHALETELARTIASLGAVREARVHLALPKQSAFIRDQEGASASVLLQLFRGRELEADQASSIVHLVASSVPKLQANDVTLIDQFGRLLSSGDQRSVDSQAASQFKYSRRLEETFKRRIENLLTPLVGVGRVRAQVVADIDFTVSEETRESFDPARSVVRSEQTSEEIRNGKGDAAAGVPGALTNQPPEVANAGAGGGTAEATANRNSARSATRNYEIDRTISHTRPQAGSIRRLSVAVLVDDSPYELVVADGEEAAAEEAAEGEAVEDVATLSEEDIQRYTALVKEVVGFDEARGDTVVVLNEAFRSIGPIEEAEALPIWKQPFVLDIARQALGAILVLVIAFGVVRPMLRGVLESNPVVAAEYISSAGGQIDGAPQLAGATAGAGAALAGPNYEEKVAAAKNITGHDPARVAQVVKKWVTMDD